MLVTIATTRGGVPEVHAQGCGDVARGMRSGKYVSEYTIDVAALRDAAVDHWSDIIAEGGMDEDDAEDQTRNMPCAKAVAREVA